MCGIAGFLSCRHFDPLKNILPEAALRLTHRGPDDSGLFFCKKSGVGLAHRRLSVIDVSEAGRQPMSNDAGNIHIIYNGEIYNYKKLRNRLTASGYSFKSASDTEVLLKAYEAWGPECVQHLVGMFALAIWDDRNQYLFIARDRLGIKPIFYHCGKDLFLFGSELKALMTFDAFPKEIEPDALSLFFHYQYVPAPKTIFKNTYKLLPGHYALVSNSGIDVKPYWRLPDATADTHIADEDDAVEALDELLTGAVSDHLISDVPLGALLSGGIDSSLIVALMQKINSSPVKTFTIGFSEKSFNEAPWAASIAGYLKTDHTELIVTPADAIEVIPKIPEIYDEPFADSSAIPTVLVSRLARSRVTVALSGDGGDEQFCGYVRYWMTESLSNAHKYTPRRLVGLLKKLPAQWMEKAYLSIQNLLPQRLVVANFQDKWDKSLLLLSEKGSLQDLYRMTICLWTLAEIKKLLGHPVPESAFEKAFADFSNHTMLSRLMHVDLKTYLPDAMLTKVDRASMAVGLEVRVPLLDHRIVEFTSMLSEKLKYRNGTGKYLLKKLLARYVPPELFVRPKMGFGVPLGDWFREKLKPFLLDYLSAERLNRDGIFDVHYVQNILKEHMSGRINHQHRLWSLVVWEMWREQWLS